MLSGPSRKAAESRLWHSVAVLKAQQDTRGWMPLDTGEIADAVRFARMQGVPVTRIARVILMDAHRAGMGRQNPAVSKVREWMCRQCLKVKPARQFTQRWGRIVSQCLECRRAQSRAYYVKTGKRKGRVAA